MNQNLNITFLDELPVFAKNAVVNVFENFNFFCKFNSVEYLNTIKISTNKDLQAHFYISKKFIELLEQSIYNHENWFENEPLLIENKQPDYIATCFYMINCLQEYAENVEDKWNRFEYTKSYQHKFGVAQENLVVEYFKIMAHEIGINENFTAPSTVFISHDIDVFEAKKQLFLTEVKTFDFSAAFRTLAKSNSDLLKELINYEESKAIKATYFWLPVQGVHQNIPHADYSIKEVQHIIDDLNTSSNFSVGLHKGAAEKNLNDEACLLGEKVALNRYHFLKYNIKIDYPKLEDSNICADFSLGFSKTIGFRNNYGLPFKPYSPILQKQFNFWVNPLHIMDSSLIYFTTGTDSEKERMVKDFIYLNKENCQIGILWHNNYLAGSYKEFFYRILDFYINGLQTTHGKH